MPIMEEPSACKRVTRNYAGPGMTLDLPAPPPFHTCPFLLLFSFFFFGICDGVIGLDLDFRHTAPSGFTNSRWQRQISFSHGPDMDMEQRDLSFDATLA